MMIHLPAIQDEWELAQKLAREMGTLNNSITGGAGNVAGFLGELAAARYLNYLGCQRQNTYQHDLVVGGFLLDVKTKRRTVRPEPDYLSAITQLSAGQQCQGYIFTSVEFTREVPKWITLCGWMPKKKYLERAKPVARGEIQENGWKCSEDCLVLPYGELIPMFDLEVGLMIRMNV